MAAWLIEPTRHPLPDEYLELFLCRDVYHCTPGELDAQDYKTVTEHLACIAAESMVKEAREKRNGKTGRKPTRRGRARH